MGRITNVQSVGTSVRRQRKPMLLALTLCVVLSLFALRLSSWSSSDEIGTRPPSKFGNFRGGSSTESDGAGYMFAKYWGVSEADGVLDKYWYKRPNKGLTHVILVDVHSHPKMFEYFEYERIAQFPRACVTKLTVAEYETFEKENPSVAVQYRKAVGLDMEHMPKSMKINILMRVDMDSSFEAVRKAKVDFFESTFLVYLKTNFGGSTTYEALAVFHGIQLALRYFHMLSDRFPAKLWKDTVFFYLGWGDFEGSLPARIASEVHKQNKQESIFFPKSNTFCTNHLWMTTESFNPIIFKDTADYFDISKGGGKKDNKQSVTSTYGELLPHGLRGLMVEWTCGAKVDDLPPRSTKVGLLLRDSFPLSRHLVNTAELLKELERAKIHYEIISLEKMSICEQILTVGSLSVFAGPHGAGLFAWSGFLFPELPIVNFSPRPCRAHVRDYFHVVGGKRNSWDRTRVVPASLVEGTWKVVTEYWSKVNPVFAEDGFTKIQSGWDSPVCQWLMQEIYQGIMAFKVLEGDKIRRYDHHEWKHQNKDAAVLNGKLIHVGKFWPLRGNNGLPTRLIDNTHYKEATAAYFWTDIPLAVQAIKEADKFLTPTPTKNPDYCYKDDGSLLKPKYNYPVRKQDCSNGYLQSGDYNAWKDLVEEAKKKYGVGKFEKASPSSELPYNFSIVPYNTADSV
eukprot:g989.t1